MSQRTERVADQIRSELSQILRMEMKDPRIQLASISAVEVTRDFSHAKILVSVLGDDLSKREEAVETLRQAKGWVRSHLARRLRLRQTPELHFELDRGAEHSQRINELLAGLQPATDEEPVDEGT
ncbi:MAG: 30S ribosome-binding factor RbfA [Thermoanaerobaculia bacterium]|nr:30S ribosome-binding factor RbfA [Thermoanaerobaculia bacterium]